MVCLNMIQSGVLWVLAGFGLYRLTFDAIYWINILREHDEVKPK